MKSVPSENILKLRELTDQICSREESEEEYKKVVKELKNIVEKGVIEIENSKTPKSKMKCYENMCSTIKTILTSIKIL
jgi:ribosomal protein S20